MPLWENIENLFVSVKEVNKNLFVSVKEVNKNLFVSVKEVNQYTKPHENISTNTCVLRERPLDFGHFQGQNIFSKSVMGQKYSSHGGPKYLFAIQYKFGSIFLCVCQHRCM